MSRGAARPKLPLALCGTLVVGAALVQFPHWAEAVVRPARWWMCLPLRALPPRHVEAAAPAAGPRPVLARDALARLAADATRGAERLFAPAVPVICHVLERRAPGAARLPTLLVLDRRAEDVGDCLMLATRGDCLVGYLDAGGAGDPAAGGHAVVRCLHARAREAPPRRLLAVGEVESDEARTALRFVLEPANRIDEWPLRVSLLEDPYLASRLRSAGGVVRTGAATASGIAIPAGLVVGKLRVWGYVEEHATALPVGFFVELAFDPRAIATVVLWRRPAAAGPAAADAGSAATMVEHPARSARLASERLYLLTGAGREVPRGAAVIARDGQLFGTVDETGPGDAVATAFGVPGRSWSLLLLPDDPAQAPVECTAEVVAAAAGHVEVRLGAPVAAFAGEVLTGAQGLHCPAGVRIGRIAAVEDGGRRLRIAYRPPARGGMAILQRMEGAP